MDSARLRPLFPLMTRSAMYQNAHSITSSARRRIDSEIVRPIALAVLRLITSSSDRPNHRISSAPLDQHPPRVRRQFDAAIVKLEPLD